MAQIAEDMFLLLLDNADAQPGLDRSRRGRVLSGAVLLDLALLCRVRPSMNGEAVAPGRLVALAGPMPLDPIMDPAFELLARRPLTPAAAVSKLRRGVQDNIAGFLEHTGQIRRVQLQSKRFHHPPSWPVVNRERVTQARAALLSALFDKEPPTPQTAAIISLLHAVDGLGALLSLNDRGWRWVHMRASEIAGGGWVDESEAALPEMNLAVTASAVRPALT
ncbi:GOLPH3/VPS74 family protein [Mycolicibacterium stellerae]|uniref:GOLPH3/VPS74 family protein n=1 Tax=Mycolicibacterium stellerae TaxID=2358193 RepID=UPI000F0B9F23|nr:GPP34 family phosphoprotein [Mycolicibacterium stellerae]